MHLEIGLRCEQVGQTCCIRADIAGAHRQQRVAVGQKPLERRQEFRRRLHEYGFDAAAAAHGAGDRAPADAPTSDAAAYTFTEAQLALGRKVAKRQFGEDEFRAWRKAVKRAAKRDD